MQSPASPPNNGLGPEATAPLWVQIAGFVTGALVLFFLLTLGTVATFGIVNACAIAAAKFFLVAGLALGVGLTSSFLGGRAALEGRVPLDTAAQHPVAFSVAGGIGAFLVTLVVANYIFPNPEDCSVKKVDLEMYRRVAEVSYLQGHWADQDKNPTVVWDVEKKSEPAAAALLRIPRHELRSTQDVDRYFYASSAYLLRGLAIEELHASGQLPDTTGIIAAAEDAILYADSAKSLLSRLKEFGAGNGADADEYRTALADLEGLERAEFVAYHTMLAGALLARAAPTQERLANLTSQTAKIPPAFLQTNRPCREPIVKRLCTAHSSLGAQLCSCA